MELSKLEEALKKSWAKDTCFPRCADDWTPENPAVGQCVITVLIVQDYFGGEIMHCKHHFHYWNRLPDGRKVDFTREQFPEGTIICFDGFDNAEFLLNGQSAVKYQTKQRYNLLKQRIERYLAINP
jgi:hypothetical protein